MKYGKLIDGEIHFAPNPIRTESVFIGNPPAEICLAEGYKPVVFTEAPEVGEGSVAVPGWEETESNIAETWSVEPEGDISDTELVEILMGGGGL